MPTYVGSDLEFKKYFKYALFAFKTAYLMCSLSAIWLALQNKKNWLQNAIMAPLKACHITLPIDNF